MIDCKQLAEMILRYRDGTLSDDETQYVREHIHLCPPCLDLLNSYEEVVEVLHRLKPVCLPPGMLEDLKRRLRDRTTGSGPCGLLASSQRRASSHRACLRPFLVQS